MEAEPTCARDISPSSRRAVEVSFARGATGV
jgi:hypothetical protein